MPNLYNPRDFNIFEFSKEVKKLRDCFAESSSNLTLPFGNTKFYIFCDESTNNTFIKIGTQENELFGALRLAQTIFRGIDYHIVERIFTTEKYRNNGIMKLLYSHCLELNYNLMSDSTQTTFGSKDFWKKAKDYFPNKNCYVINLESNHKKLYTKQEDFKIWGKENDDDFDILDKEDKISMLEQFKEKKTISKNQMDFFINNIDNLKSRNTIRMTLE